MLKKTGVDALLDFLLAEVALCGAHGATSADFRRFIRKFYSDPENNLSKYGVENSTAPREHNDRPFLEKVWGWLVNHRDIRILLDNEPRTLTLSQFEALEVPDEAGGNGEEGVVPLQASTPRQSSAAPVSFTKPAPESADDDEFSRRLRQALEEEEEDAEVGGLSTMEPPTGASLLAAVDSRTPDAPSLPTAETANSPRHTPLGPVRGSPQNGFHRDRLRKVGAQNTPQTTQVFPEAAKPTKSPRLFASQERTWQAVAGHSVDFKKVSQMEFVLLSIIASRGPEGILQPELRELSGQDKRSVPKRTDDLAKKGYIEKKPVSTQKTRTSICVHRRFVKESAFSEENKDAAGIKAVVVGNALILPNFVTFLHNTLKETRIVAMADIRHQLGVTEKQFNSKTISRTLRRLEDTGFIARVKARQKGSKETYLLCIKLLRPPNEEDLKAIGFRRKTAPLNEVDDRANTLEGDPDGEDVMRDLELEVEFEDGTPEIPVATNRPELVASSSRIPPQWTPDRQIAHLLWDATNAAGRVGTDSRVMRAMTMGNHWKRPLEALMSRLTDNWENSQPKNLQHLALIRDTAVTKEMRFVHYVYRTFPNYQKAVDAGEASWEAVSKDAASKAAGPKKGRPKKITNGGPPEAGVHSLGFAEFPANMFLAPGGSSTLTDAVQSVANKKNGTWWDKRLLKQLEAKDGTPKKRFSLLEELNVDSRSEKRVSVAKAPNGTFKKPPPLLTMQQRIDLGLPAKGRLKKEVEDLIRQQAKQLGSDVASAALTLSPAAIADANKPAVYGPYGQTAGPSNCASEPMDEDRASTGIIPQPVDFNAGDPNPSRDEASPERAIAASSKRKLNPQEQIGGPSLKKARPSESTPGAESTLPSIEKFSIPVELQGKGNYPARPKRANTVEPIKVEKLPRKEQRVVREAIQQFTERTEPGMYTSPHMTRKVGQGRPRRAYMAVIKSDRLRGLEWFKAPPTPSLQTPRRPPKLEIVESVAVSTPELLREDTCNGGPSDAAAADEPEVQEGSERSSKVVKLKVRVQSPAPLVPGEPAVSGSAEPEPVDTAMQSRPHTTPPPPASIPSATSGGTPALADAMVVDSGPRTEVETISKRGVTLGRGTSYLMRTQIIMELLERCGGVFPGQGEINHPFYRLWEQMAPKNLAPPDKGTLTKTIKGLLDSGKLKTLTFAFSTSYGVPINKKILALANIDPAGPEVKAFQHKTIDANPKKYYPEQVLDLVRDPRTQGPKQRIEKEMELEVEPLHPVELRLEQRLADTAKSRKRKKNEEQAKDFQERQMTRAALGKGLAGLRGGRRARAPRLDTLNTPNTLNTNGTRKTLAHLDEEALNRLGLTRLGRDRSLSPYQSTAADDPESEIEQDGSPEPEEEGTGDAMDVDMMSIADSDEDYEQHEKTTLTDPDVRFHASSGTFSTEFVVVRDTPTSLRVDPDGSSKVLPKTLHEVVAQGLAKAPETTCRHPHERIWLTIPEHKHFYQEVNVVVAWEDQFRTSEDMRECQPKDPFVHMTYPGEQIEAPKLGDAGRKWVMADECVNNRFTIYPDGSVSTVKLMPGSKPGKPGRRPKTVEMVEDENGVLVPEKRRRTKKSKISTQADKRVRPVVARDGYGSIMELDSDVEVADAEEWNRRLQEFNESQKAEADRQRRMLNPTATERLTGLTGDPDQPNRAPRQTYTWKKKHPPAPARKKEKENVLIPEPTRFKRLFYTLIVASSMVEGSGQDVDWNIVKSASSRDIKFNLDKTKKMWLFAQKHMADQITAVTTEFQEKFLEAYEAGKVDSINNPADYDWNKLVEWAMANCGFPEMSLPADPDDLRDWNVAESDFQRINREDWYKIGLPQYVKEQRLFMYRYAAPIHEASNEDPEEENTVRARSWIRSNVATPESAYNGNVAHSKLVQLGETAINIALTDFLGRTILRPRKGKRMLPGRNYDFTVTSAHDFKRTLVPEDLLEAVAFKKKLDEAFRNPDPSKRSVEILPTSKDGEIIAISMLFANGRIKIVPRLPPVNNTFGAPIPRLSVWGFIERDYRTRYLDRSRMHWPVDIVKTDKYRFGNGLAEHYAPREVHRWDTIPPPPMPDPSDPMALIPIWVAIDGETLLWSWWYRVLNVILQAILFAPGTTIADIHRLSNKSIEVFEIQMVVGWLERIGAVGRTRGNQFIVLENWYCVFGDQLVDEEDWFGEVIKRKPVPRGMGWRLQQKQNELVRAEKKPAGRPRKRKAGEERGESNQRGRRSKKPRVEIGEIDGEGGLQRLGPPPSGRLVDRALAGGEFRFGVGQSQSPESVSGDAEIGGWSIPREIMGGEDMDAEGEDVDAEGEVDEGWVAQG
ncbi:hypothetical protein GQ43DRAFT_477160 [Delitschia confertaspora ATCC 74209]|uniref:B-block binding subunit of TFIIIC domain-containing protein n=1 Tax=Delitschia confertaspora ATCC 74209 TaxID=1513339 RepID=A0A9P4JTU5_9PLEO|nr:hypothetical protein GQ43DRAFT_477160 [Delitschia confertaspora ATCC 74209]